MDNISGGLPGRNHSEVYTQGYDQIRSIPLTDKLHSLCQRTYQRKYVSSNVYRLVRCELSMVHDTTCHPHTTEPSQDYDKRVMEPSSPIHDEVREHLEFAIEVDILSGALIHNNHLNLDTEKSGTGSPGSRVTKEAQQCNANDPQCNIQSSHPQLSPLIIIGRSGQSVSQ